MKKVTKTKYKPTLWDVMHNPRYKHLQAKAAEAMKPFTEWFELTQEKNISLMFDVYEGDAKALEKLADKWRSRLWRPYVSLAKEQAQKATERDYRSVIQSICYEFVSRQINKETPIEKIWNMPGSVFMNIRKYISQQNQEEKANISLIDEYEKDFSLVETINVKIIKNDASQDCILVKTAAQIAGVDPRTVENWIKKKYLFATKEVYVPTGNMTYYIPYTDDLPQQLRDLKRAGSDSMRHTKEGLYTIAQVVNIFGGRNIPLNRKLLERWEKRGKLVPIRIGATRYYRQNELVLLRSLLQESKSLKLKQAFNHTP